MEETKFSREMPADSISELVAYLKKEDLGNFVYRGQTKDYGSIIPSIFRKMDMRRDADLFLLPVKYPPSPLESLKVALLYTMIRKFGNVVGHYLAQQYLALSASIDITEDIGVAAFFATMCYPDYDQVLISDEQLGVIYRFDTTFFANKMSPSGVKAHPFSVEAKKGEYEVFTDRSFVEHSKTTEVDPKKMTLLSDEEHYYLLDENITTFSLVKPFLDEIDINYNKHYPGIPPNFSQFSRPRFQHGGIVQPKFLYRYAENGIKRIGHGEDIIGFEDIYGKYGMAAFYFKHSGETSNYAREMLWPPMYKDGIFATLCLILLAMKEKNISAIDYEVKDLVDIGYPDNSYFQSISDPGPYIYPILNKIDKISTNWNKCIFR